MTNGEQGLALAAEIIRATANHYGWSNFRSRPLMETLEHTSLFLDGSMKGSTPVPLKPNGHGSWQAELSLAAGSYEVKVGSEDGNVSLGSDRLEPVVAPARDIALSSDSNALRIKVDTAGTYRVSFHADATGTTALSITPR
jgi:hypothetical protein